MMLTASLKRTIRWLLAIAMLLAFAGAQAQQGLTPFEATYKVKMKGLRGEMRMSLQEVQDGFKAVSIIRPKGMARLFAKGSVDESSDFVLSNGSVLPLRYSSSDSIARKGKSSQMAFDWDTDRAQGSNNDGEFEHPIDTSTYDRVSIQYALMLDLLNGVDGRDYTMLDGHKYKELDVRITDETTIKVPYGEFSVIGVQHQARNSSRITTLWCAKELGYLPVKIEQHKKGKRVVVAVMSGYDT